MTKPTKWYVRQAKTQISLGIRVFALRMKKLGSLATHWGHSEDPDQTGWMPRWSETSLDAQSICWFCHEAAHIWNERSVHILWIAFKMMASVRFCLSYDVFERIFITLKLPLFQQKMKGYCRWHHGITGHRSSIMWCIVKTNVVQVVINLSLLQAQNPYLNQQNDVCPVKTQTSLTAWVSA